MAPSSTYSIPTPPLSPGHFRMPNENCGNSLDSTINLLDNLVTYYQHKRVWVYRTRAILDNALPTRSNTDSFNSNDLYSDRRASPPGTKTRMGPPYGDRYSDPSGEGKQPSRWMRRKKGFKLRIDGLWNIKTQPMDEMQEVDELPARKEILDMFDRMLESRLESCQRVDKLIREAHRGTS